MMEQDMYVATQSIRFEFSIPYRAWRYAETRIASFDRLDEIRAKKPTDVGVSSLGLIRLPFVKRTS